MSAADWPDLPTPRSVRLERPRIVHGHGDFFVVLANDPKAGPLVDEQYVEKEWGRCVNMQGKIRLPLPVSLAWFKSRKAAERFIKANFEEPENKYIYGKDAEGRFDLYIRSDRKKSSRRSTAA